jgi:oligoendopeptidase F
LEAVKKMRDSLKPEIKNLRAQVQEEVTQLEDQLSNIRTKGNQVICERRVLITRAQITDDDFEAVKNMRHSLKLEQENLRAQCQEDVNQLEDQLRNARTQCNQFIWETRVLIT